MIILWGRSPEDSHSVEPCSISSRLMEFGCLRQLMAHAFILPSFPLPVKKLDAVVGVSHSVRMILARLPVYVKRKMNFFWKFRVFFRLRGNARPGLPYTPVSHPLIRPLRVPLNVRLGVPETPV